MTTIKATTLRNNLASVIDEMKDSNDFMLITNRGKIVSAIIDIDLLEDLLSLTNKKYLKSIEKAREDIANGNVFTFEEVFGEI